jgi:hypothetical protein
MIERERQALTTEKDRQTSIIRSVENDLHAMRLRESEMANELRDKTALEERVETMKKEIVSITAKMKVFTHDVVHAPLFLGSESRNLTPKLPTGKPPSKCWSHNINKLKGNSTRRRQRRSEHIKT